jgi:hypothetical protein
VSVLKATRLRHLVSNKGMLLLIWCLCEAEIGAIHADQLKELKKDRS